MSRMGELLRSRLPEGMTVPEELEASWAWMEVQGWGEEDSAGCTVEPLGTGKPSQQASGAYLLRPHGGDPAYGVLFTPGAVIPEPFFSTVTRYELGGPGFDQLVPIGVTGDSGDIVALWQDDEGATRYVELTPLGPRYIADTAADFLRAAAAIDTPFPRGEHLDDKAGMAQVAFFDDAAAFVRAFDHEDDGAWLRTFRDGDGANPWAGGLNGAVLDGCPTGSGR